MITSKDLILKNISLLLLTLILHSCVTSYEYYDRKMNRKIKRYLKNDKYTYIDRGVLVHNFELSQFKNEEIIFVLEGINTLNFAKLYKINNKSTIDSASCTAFKFILLQLNSIEKGEYEIEVYGCRHSEWYKIFIE